MSLRFDRLLATLLVAGALAGAPAAGRAEGMPTVASFAEAKAMAAARNIPILVDFSAEW